MKTRRQSHESNSLGRTISLRTRTVNQSPPDRLRRRSTQRKDVVKVSKYALNCHLLPESNKLTLPSKSDSSSKYSSVSNVSKRSARKDPTPSNTARKRSATRGRKLVRIDSPNPPTKEKTSAPAFRYVTRSSSRSTSALPGSNKTDVMKQTSIQKNVQTRRAITRSMADRTPGRPIKAIKKRKVDEAQEISLDKNLDSTWESGSLPEQEKEPQEATLPSTSTLHTHRKSLRKRKVPVTFPSLTHKLRQIRRSRCYGKLSISTRSKIPSTIPVTLSSQASKRVRVEPVSSYRRQQTARSVSGIEEGLESSDLSTTCFEPHSSPSSKRVRHHSHVSSVSGRSIDDSSVASSKSTVACIQKRPSMLGLSCRLRSRRHGHPFIQRLGPPRFPFKAMPPKSTSPVIAEDNKENRNQSNVFSNQCLPVTNVFKTPSMITRHASHLSKAIIHPPAVPQTPIMNNRTMFDTDKSVSPTRAVLTPSQLSVAESVGGESISSMRSLFSSIKSPEKLQGERLKKLKSRWIEHDTDGATETASQLSALSPSIASVLNGTEHDSKERLMELLEQHSVKSWSDVFDSHEELTKIGEGVYGEVFQINGNTGDVIKIFPIEGDMSIMDGSRAQMTFHTVYPEVYVSKRLTELSKKTRDNRTVCFSQLKRATLVQGKLPESFVIQWKIYDALYSSENICLNHLPESQLWIILEYEYAGVTLDKYKFTSYLEARSVFEQLSLSLAAAEAELQFEHRDLHWGNVLIRPTRLDKLRFRVNGVNYSVWTYGVRAAIIDFTVSRMCYRGNTVYVDMSENPEIFNVYDGEYQNEIYRMMRSLNGNDWRSFKPKSNLMWLHYLCDKLLHEVKICARGDTHFEAIYSELVALEEELRQVVQPPLNVLRSVPNSCSNSVVQHHIGSTAAHTKAGGSGSYSFFPIGKGHGKQGATQNLQVPQYIGAADFVSKNFYFDSCRMDSGTGL